jgi:Ca2+-binding EF-hand superfamily protein
MSSNSLPDIIQKQAEECFKKYDEDSSGSIELCELKKLMVDVSNEIGISPPTDDDINTILKETDTNNDKTIQKEEFLELFKIIYFMRTMNE